MKLFALGIGFVVVATVFVALAPTTEAVGTCSSLKGDDCDYYACVGWSNHGWYETCQYGVHHCDVFCPGPKP